jgi:uncharacterized protein (DUF433 family)
VYDSVVGPRSEEVVAMTMPVSESAPVKPPTEVPLYTIGDVARYLRLPLFGAIALVGRVGGRWAQDLIHRYYHKAYYPVPFIYPLDELHDLSVRLTFRQFASVFVRAAVFQSFGARSEEGYDRQFYERFWHDFWDGRGVAGWDADLFDTPADATSLDRFVGPFVNRVGQEKADVIRKWAALRLERVVVVDGLPIRLFPFSREPAHDCPRTVVIDPEIRFGRPTLSTSGIPTDILFDRHQAGDSVADLAADYDLPLGDVEEALRYEGSRVTPLFLDPGW